MLLVVQIAARQTTVSRFVFREVQITSKGKLANEAAKPNVYQFSSVQITISTCINIAGISA